MTEKAFETINGAIQDFIAARHDDWYALKDKDYKLPLSDAIFCATDVPRNRAFFAAISAAITDLKLKTSKIEVLYAGSGTGILGFFALALGASHVTFLEHNPYTLEFSRALAAYLGFLEQITFIEGDATLFLPAQPHDLLISETITSGFVREEFPRIINHLLPFGKPEARIIPERFQLTIQECAADKRILATHEYTFISREGFQDQMLPKPHPETEFLRWKTVSNLSGDVMLSSGDCVSYLNVMTQPIAGFAHQLFELSE